MKNPSSLHNTEFKKSVRALMLKGERPSECAHCWEIEDSLDKTSSDRYSKSDAPWAAQLKHHPFDASENVKPSYLEVSFSNNCNFRCAYCSPNISSKWMEEIKSHGAYPTRNRHNNLEVLTQQELLPIDEANNPYIKSFWNWWPEVRPTLKVFRITGGEPLLSENTLFALDRIALDDNPDLTLAVNSNLGVNDHRLSQFIQKIQALTPRVNAVEIYTSIDCWGPQAEYLRYGLDLSKFVSNVEEVITKLPNARIVFMVTYNALSLFSFRKLIDWIQTLKSQAPGNRERVRIDVSYLRHPEFISAKILPQEFLLFSQSNLVAMEKNEFLHLEIMKMKRTVDYLASQTESAARRPGPRIDFYRFFSEYDKRRKTSFLKTFPELSAFWSHCQKLSQQAP